MRAAARGTTNLSDQETLIKTRLSERFDSGRNGLRSNPGRPWIRRVSYSKKGELVLSVSGSKSGIQFS